MPSIALFLLLYALGVSCGMASYGGGYRSTVLPALSTAFVAGAQRTAFLRALLCCLCGAAVQSALILLAGLSAWLLPLWAVTVLARAITVGLCVGLCLDALRTGIPHAEWIVSILAAGFAAAFVSELRLCILPLLRRTEPNAEDAAYLSVGLRLALFYLLLSLVLTAVSLLVISRVLGA